MRRLLSVIEGLAEVESREIIKPLRGLMLGQLDAISRLSPAQGGSPMDIIVCAHESVQLVQAWRAQCCLYSAFS